MLKYLLDTNCYDKIFSNVDHYPLIKYSILSGQINLIGTHIENDEILKISNLRYKLELLELNRKLVTDLVETEGFVYEMSRLGFAKLFPWDRIDEFMKLTKENINNFEDILLTFTAEKNDATIVTDDLDLQKALNSTQVKYSSYFDFIESLQN